ncbi:MAG: alpha/beta hydrolase [Myxococcota bacterium]|nr:alpha/beta hydrolase [Myxococcota bacterium]
MKHIVYLHGFASSENSHKGTTLRARLADVTELHTPNMNRPSFEELTYSGMLSYLDSLDANLPESARWYLIGSSLGGYVAARWAELHPERVERLVLLCPAIDMVSRWRELLGGPMVYVLWKRNGAFFFPDHNDEPKPVHFGIIEDAQTKHPARPKIQCPTVIVHGSKDETVPLAFSEEYAATYPDVRLEVVDDDHNLIDSLDVIERVVREHFELHG